MQPIMGSSACVHINNPRCCAPEDRKFIFFCIPTTVKLLHVREEFFIVVNLTTVFNTSWNLLNKIILAFGVTEDRRRTIRKECRKWCGSKSTIWPHCRPNWSNGIRSLLPQKVCQCFSWLCSNGFDEISTWGWRPLGDPKDNNPICFTTTSSISEHYNGKLKTKVA